MFELLILAFLKWSHPTTCDSTIFGYPGDGYGGRTPTVLTGEPVKPTDFGIAHRTWRMGSVIRVKNLRTGLVAYGVVIDRGPYGKVTPAGKWFNGAPMFREQNKGREGKWRGCADLTPALAKAIGHKGRDIVKIWRVEK